MTIAPKKTHLDEQQVSAGKQVSAVRLEGGLFNPDLLEQIRQETLKGQQPADFGLPPNRRITDEASRIYADATTYWKVFKKRLDDLPPDDPATSLTRNNWMIPFLQLLGYELVYTPQARQIDGESFAISHETQHHTPVHIVGAGQPLDAKPSRGGRSPHALVQEYLNHSEALWGLVTNGRRLRLLRNISAVQRQAYLEFDLQAIFEEERFSDFLLLYRLMHFSRLPQQSDAPTKCLLETYYQTSLEQGGRVREKLRTGVEQCLLKLTNGMLRQPQSQALRAKLQQQSLTPNELYRDLLRLVYRFLFLLVAEDRGLVSDLPLYRRHYGMARFRRLVDRPTAYTEDTDLWCSLQALWIAFTDQQLAAMLGAPPLNGGLFQELEIDSACISNRDLLEALWHLIYYEDDQTHTVYRVNYGALDVEELGSVYESLLDLHPEISSGDPPEFSFSQGQERKSTGSYYTPHVLVQELVRSALEPVLKDRLQRADTPQQKEQALLNLRVVDPACGSGHFLLAAARFLGKELARIRTGEQEPNPEAQHRAVRDVIARCIYGVDKNPLAVDLCRVALWLESLTGKNPLNFLDHHIRCGDSLVGVFDLDVLKEGIPDEAFERAKNDVPSDDPIVVKSLKSQNRSARKGQFTLPFHSDPTPLAVSALAQQAGRLTQMQEDTLEQVHAKEDSFHQLHSSAAWLYLQEACNLYTAAFFQTLNRENPAPITTESLNRHLQHQPVDGRVVGLARELAQKHSFFHWPLEFPDVMQEHGGFDVVLGNPPWERIKLQDEEFFAGRAPEIANAQNAARRKPMIQSLATQNPALYREYGQALHDADVYGRWLRSSGRFPLTATGDINLYALFAELATALVHPQGRAGLIVPTNIATDATYQNFFKTMVGQRQLVSLLDFENKGLFPGVHDSYKFSLLTLAGPNVAKSSTFAFFCHSVEEARDPEKRLRLTPADIERLNPNTRTCPVLRTARDAELLKALYRRVPVLWREKPLESNPWQLDIMSMFHMSNDSHLFLSQAEPQALPLYEAKLFHQFDHRWATYTAQDEMEKDKRDTRDVMDAEKADPGFRIVPRYHVPQHEVKAKLDAHGWSRRWLLAVRNVTNTTNERTVIAGLLPYAGVGNNTHVFLLGETGLQPAGFATALGHRPWPAAQRAAWLLATLNSFVLDYIARCKVGGSNLSHFYIKQLAVPSPETFLGSTPFYEGRGREPLRRSWGDWVAERVLELVYTTYDLAPFAEDLLGREPEGPFPWDEERRFEIRCELDAAFFHLYLPCERDGGWRWAPEGQDGAVSDEEVEALQKHFPTPRDAVAYILDQFPIVRTKDEKRYGHYRTKERILDYYDAMRTTMAW
ncbi:MAG TPA: N-6 DNA methylase [Chthonomonas sp.]|uniref:Eco57I restriction-modification methylase domain-containing protein n=1 Tax=Chthonomonas sp. TaxID=2282153 RepID=UPI002B4AFEF6|nr:N-6 DNA methylase [Chthonomonas sp.]HLI47344.1 N-6 DNA methylase [Chthonomonas sp.]